MHVVWECSFRHRKNKFKFNLKCFQTVFTNSMLARIDPKSLKLTILIIEISNIFVAIFYFVNLTGSRLTRAGPEIGYFYSEIGLRVKP